MRKALVGHVFKLVLVRIEINPMETEKSVWKREQYELFIVLLKQAAWIKYDNDHSGSVATKS